MWEVLQNTFERKSMGKQICLKCRLLTFKFNPATETLDSYFIKFDAMKRELKAAGATMEEYDVVCHLLLTLPPEYEMIVTALETLSCEKLSLPFMLFDEETKRTSRRNHQKMELQSTAVFRAQTGGGGGRNQRRNQGRNSRNAANAGGNNPPFQFTCYNCGVAGHKRYDCPKPQ
jgi:hypothetical protein